MRQRPLTTAVTSGLVAGVGIFVYASAGGGELGVYWTLVLAGIVALVITTGVLIVLWAFEELRSARRRDSIRSRRTSREG